LNYDCIIIGGGLSGLVCGLKCQIAGLSCAVFSAGASALAFSSGSVDLLGRYPDRGVVYSPFEVLPDFIREYPEHPYAVCGPDLIRDSLFFLKEQSAAGGLGLYANGLDNHFHVTTLGTIKPTFFSQESVFSDEVREAFAKRSKIAIINFEGFRDFHPGLAAVNLKRQTLFKDCEIVTGSVRIPQVEGTPRRPHELRSVDISRIFEQGRLIDDIAVQIKKIAGGAGFVGVPAFIGLKDYQALERLREKTGLLIYEVPTLPPSILGLRLEDALRNRFTDLGGVLIAGDRVIGGDLTSGRLDHVHTNNYGKTRVKARNFLLATGSFFSGGLTSRFDIMEEPVFGLALNYTKGRGNWSDRAFFSPGSHAFLTYGLRVDQNLHPEDGQGRTVSNLYAAGAVLGGYNPIRESSGGGVAVATAYKAALAIIKDCENKAHD
jgi:glycerol-3-phosphate dehydrogenase subunit B